MLRATPAVLLVIAAACATAPRSPLADISQDEPKFVEARALLAHGYPGLALNRLMTMFEAGKTNPRYGDIGATLFEAAAALDDTVLVPHFINATYSEDVAHLPGPVLENVNFSCAVSAARLGALAEASDFAHAVSRRSPRAAQTRAAHALLKTLGTPKVGTPEQAARVLDALGVPPTLAATASLKARLQAEKARVEAEPIDAPLKTRLSVELSGMIARLAPTSTP